MVDVLKIKITVARYSYLISTSVVFFLSLIFIIISPFWILLPFLGLIGGIIYHESTLKVFLSGFIGCLIAQLLYFNIHVFEAIESINVLMKIIGINEVSLIVFILIICMWSSFVGLGSIIGSSGYKLFKILVIDKRELMIKEL